MKIPPGKVIFGDGGGGEVGDPVTSSQTLRKLVVLLRSAVPPQKSSALIWAYQEETAPWYL
jgi:hypothetical protein